MRLKSAYKILLLIAVILPTAVFAYSSPGRPTGYVNDFAKIIPAESRLTMESQLKSLEDSTGSQVSVVTVQTLGDETIETYAEKLFAEWGIGRKGHDDGLLILVALAEKKARLEVGYGLEGTVTDLQSGNIIRNIMIPAFKTGDYAKGIQGAVDAVSELIRKDPGVTTNSGSVKNSEGSDIGAEISHNFFFFVFLIIFVVNLLARMLGRTRSWWLGGVLGGILGVIIGLLTSFVPTGIIAIVILTVAGLIFDYYVSKHPPKSGGSSGIWPMFFGGGGSGRGFGGGFGGFGGGRSGGGGASGGW